MIHFDIDEEIYTCIPCTNKPQKPPVSRLVIVENEWPRLVYSQQRRKAKGETLRIEEPWKLNRLISPRTPTFHRSSTNLLFCRYSRRYNSLRSFICICVCVWGGMCVCVCVHECVVFIQIHLHMCTHTHEHACIHTYVCTHTYTHAHTYIPKSYDLSIYM